MDHPEAAGGIQALPMLYIVQLLVRATDLLEHGGG